MHQAVQDNQLVQDSQLFQVYQQGLDCREAQPNLEVQEVRRDQGFRQNPPYRLGQVFLEYQRHLGCQRRLVALKDLQDQLLRELLYHPWGQELQHRLHLRGRLSAQQDLVNLPARLFQVFQQHQVWEADQLEPQQARQQPQEEGVRQQPQEQEAALS